MTRAATSLVIDARPRGSSGPWAGAHVSGRPVLEHLLDVAEAIGAGPGPVPVHARLEEHEWLRGLVTDRGDAVRLVTGPTPEGAAVLRADRLYDPNRLRRALRRGRDPEAAVLWRLDRPSALEHAEAELLRRRSYQPLGRFWALAPARALARFLVETPVRPNALTIAAGGLMLTAAVLVATASTTIAGRLGAASLLAIALVLDTADGHLARLQGTASDFGRWLDAVLDELADMALHAAIAWAAFARSGQPGWLVLSMGYAAGKYLFVVGQATRAEAAPTHDPRREPATRPSPVARLVRAIGHADVRWHLWILLAALGRLDAALVVYAAYFPARTVAGAFRGWKKGGVPCAKRASRP
jgi:phosphatidylglycerophosphate synthase